MQIRWHVFLALLLALCRQFSFAEAVSSNPLDSLHRLQQHFSAVDTNYIKLSNGVVIALLDSDLADSALSIARLSLSASERIHYKFGVAQSKFLLGKAYIYKFNFSLGKDFIGQAHALFDSLHYQKGIADCSLQLGVILFSTEKNYSGAISEFAEANKIYLSLGDARRASTANYLEGLCLLELSDYSRAEEKLLLALRVKDSIGDETAVYECRNGLADLYFRTKQLEKSKDYYQQCLKYFERARNVSGISQSLLGIGKVYSSTGQLDSAKKYLLAAYNESQKVPSNPVIQNSMQLLSSLILTQIDLVTKQIQKEKKIRYLLTASVVLLLILVVMAYQRYRFKQKKNKQLQDTMDELKRTQNQLLLSEKLASVGQLTAGVAHEINNPINFVTGNINPLKKNFAAMKMLLHKIDTLDSNGDLPKQLTEIDALKKEIDFNYTMDESEKLLTGIEEGSRRTAAIVKGLRQFSRMDEDVKKMANINEGIESTLILLQNKLKYQNIELVLTLGNIPDISCYPGQLNQVFMNLLTNAIDAIGEPAAAKASAAERKILVSTSADGRNLKISVRDTGQGMTEEVKKKIFDPFFTTKEVGKGTGLGLSISYGIIEKHNGKIEVKSEVGKGTEFIILLPI